jgi:two-component system cell cycle sensor histidine kinase/response regulator CckA
LGTSPQVEPKPTILVVDDEPEIRKLVKAMLAPLGYHVVIADTGEQAVRLFHKEPSVDLLLTDVVAPGMSGPMLAQQLRQTNPTLRVLFMSGYDATQVVQKFVVEQGYSLLIKPFTSEQLREKVRSMLE